MRDPFTNLKTMFNGSNVTVGIKNRDGRRHERTSQKQYAPSTLGGGGGGGA